MKKGDACIQNAASAYLVNIWSFIGEVETFDDVVGWVVVAMRKHGEAQIRYIVEETCRDHLDVPSHSLDHTDHGQRCVEGEDDIKRTVVHMTVERKHTAPVTSIAQQQVFASKSEMLWTSKGIPHKDSLR